MDGENHPLASSSIHDGGVNAQVQLKGWKKRDVTRRCLSADQRGREETRRDAYENSTSRVKWPTSSAAAEAMAMRRDRADGDGLRRSRGW